MLKNRALLIPVCLFVLAFLFRLVGIGWGLKNEFHNQSYHPDEIVNFQVANQIDLASGQVAPHFYNYGTAYFFVYNVASKMVAGYGGGPTGDPNLDWDYQRRCELAGRIISAAAGAGVVVVIWLVCRRLTTLLGSAFGAGLACFAPGLVIHSRFATVDVFGVFFIALSAMFALRLLPPQLGSLAEADESKASDLKSALLSGLFAGIAGGTKYTEILVLLVLITVVIGLRRKGWAVSLMAAIGAAIVGFFVTTPGALLEWSKFTHDLQYELQHSASGHGLIFIGTTSGFLYHLGNLMVGVGVLAVVASLFSLAWAIWRKRIWAIALTIFLVVYYIVIGRAEVTFLRYIFPLIIPMAVGFGYGVGCAFREGGWRGRVCIVAGVFALVGNPFFDFGGIIGAARYTHFMISTDPRDEALIYMRQQGKGSVAGLVKDPWFWSVPFVPDAGVTRNLLPLPYAELTATTDPKVVRFLPDGSLEGRKDWDVRLLTDYHPDFVVYSSFESGDEERLSNSSRLDAGTQALIDDYKTFYSRLDADYELQAVFGGLMPEVHDLMYIHPTVYVWKKKAN